MTITRVKSSQLHSVGHESENSRLHVNFNCSKCHGSGLDARNGAVNCPHCDGTGHGSTYVYENVPAVVHQAILDSESKGSKFHELIKSRPHDHPYKRVK